jgi:putative ABC transport system substrate-binding protein
LTGPLAPQRRRLLAGAGALLIAPSIVRPQARSVRVGVLSPRRESVILRPALARLAELGYVRGKNLTVEYRSADGVIERFPQLARELVDAKCEVIFASGSVYAARALREATTTIPIIIVAIEYDPVRAGIITNLPRPGGNITGVVLSALELVAKRVEILHEVLPQATRFSVFADPYSKEQFENMRLAAERLRLQLLPHAFETRPYAFDLAFDQAEKAKASAVILPTSPVFFDRRASIYEMALKRRMPLAVGGSFWWTGHGWFLGYGVIADKTYARAGDIAATILKGKPPGDIPVEQPSDFEFALNMRTAKVLGVAIPPAVMVRASRLVE